jgi:hypothetical protein
VELLTMRGMWRTVSCGHRRGTSRWWTRSWRRCRTRTSPSSTSATPARGTRYSAVLNGRLPQLTKRPAQLTTLSGLDRAAQDGRGPALTVHHVRALCPPPPSLFLGSVAVSGRGDHWCAVLAPQASFASHCARGASAVGVTMPSLAVHLRLIEAPWTPALLPVAGQWRARRLNNNTHLHCPGSCRRAPAGWDWVSRTSAHGWRCRWRATWPPPPPRRANG